MEEKLDLAQILMPHRDEKHAVVLHDYPDPDAIASAYAHKVISAQFGIEVDIFYSGEISHQQNIALVKLLGLQLVQYGPDQNMGGYQAAVFVDHQGTPPGRHGGRRSRRRRRRWPPGCRWGSDDTPPWPCCPLRHDEIQASLQV